MESKAGSMLLFYRASLSGNRFTLFRTHSRAMLTECGGGVYRLAARPRSQYARDDPSADKPVQNIVAARLRRVTGVKPLKHESGAERVIGCPISAEFFVGFNEEAHARRIRYAEAPIIMEPQFAFLVLIPAAAAARQCGVSRRGAVRARPEMGRAAFAFRGLSRRSHRTAS